MPQQKVRRRARRTFLLPALLGSPLPGYCSERAAGRQAVGGSMPLGAGCADSELLPPRHCHILLPAASSL